MFMIRCRPDRAIRYATLLITAMVCLAWSSMPQAGEFALSKEMLSGIEQQYGEYARQRVLLWNELIIDNRHLEEIDKLKKVNDFFNEIDFINDIDHWGKEDYWATPLQMLISNGGDCEDFSIAKYFTLREMGVPADRMRLTYVKALELNQAHMVLTYYSSPDAEPLILDNLVTDILPSSERDDLLPVYSFNGNGLWLAKSRGTEQRIGHASRLSRWKEVIAKIGDEQIPLSY
ncbi:MAG: transglutaminase-like cysteine peptidase [Gammaproteobacteria bacterium]|jgi:predicted transglutaminase-like cysteine proteinase